MQVSLASLALAFACLVASSQTTAFCVETIKTTRSTALHGWMDFNPFSGSGSGKDKDFIDEQWEAQQAILRARQGVLDKEHLKEKYTQKPPQSVTETKPGVPQAPAKTSPISTLTAKASKPKPAAAAPKPVADTTPAAAPPKPAAAVQKKPSGMAGMFFATASSDAKSQPAEPQVTVAEVKQPEATKAAAKKPMFKMPWDK
jgi:hypothetical protein